KNLINELGITQEELSSKLGKSRSHIANTMRLLSLPEDVIVYISNGELTMGHGRALLGLKDLSQLKSVVEQIRKNNLNVRQVEKIISELNTTKPKKKAKKATKDVFITEQEDRLRTLLGTNVNIQKSKHKGKIEIEFYSNDELNHLIQLLDQ